MMHERSDYTSNGMHVCRSDECDRDGKRDYWPCEWVELVARLTGVPVEDIDAVEISEAGPVVFNIRMRPNPELIEFTVHRPKVACDAGDVCYEHRCTLPEGHDGWHQSWRDGQLWAEWREATP